MLVIVKRLIKMVYYDSVSININITGLTNVVMTVLKNYDDFLDSIMSNETVLFMLKFWSSLCYFLSIQQRVFIAFFRNRWPNKIVQSKFISKDFFVNENQNDKKSSYL